MNYFGAYFRRYETVIQELLERGHEVHLGREHERSDDRKGDDQVARADDGASVRWFPVGTHTSRAASITRW